MDFVFKYHACLYRNWIQLVTFKTIFDTVSSPHSSWSMFKPIYLTIVFLSIACPSHIKLTLVTSLSFRLEPNNISSVLPGCIDSLLSASQLKHSIRFSFSSTVIVVIFLSSAYWKSTALYTFRHVIHEAKLAQVYPVRTVLDK